MDVDREAVARFLAYWNKPKPRPMRWFYMRLGYDIPELK